MYNNSLKENEMSFLSVLASIGHKAETVFSDTEKGLALASPFLSLIPGGALIGPIISEVESIVNGLTAKGQTLTTAQVSAITQTVASYQSLAALKLVPTAPTAAAWPAVAVPPAGGTLVSTN
jgi:hypothetical protein